MPGNTRLHALDAIRSLALLLGLIVHGSMPFWPGLEHTGWPIVDDSGSQTLLVLVYTLHMFRMAVFFLIAGFFAQMSLGKKGAAHFWKDRCKRILLPLVVAYPLGLLLIVPLLLTAMEYTQGSGDTAENLHTLIQINEAGNPILLHLWFLYYLLIFYLPAQTGRFLLTRIDPAGRVMARLDRVFGKLVHSTLLPLLLCIPGALTLIGYQNWLAWEGIPTPGIRINEELPALGFYFSAFCCGWLLCRRREYLQAFSERWGVYLVGALILTPLSALLFRGDPFATPVVENRVAIAFAYSLACWCWTFTVLGLGLRFFRQESRTIRYIADSSYWIYLIHLPLMLGLQVWLMGYPWHWSVKFILILLISVPLLFLSYARFVRHSALGHWLNGARPAGSLEGQGKAGK